MSVHNLWTEPADNVWTSAGFGGQAVGYRSGPASTAGGNSWEYPVDERWTTDDNSGGRTHMWTTDRVGVPVLHSSYTCGNWPGAARRRLIHRPHRTEEDD